MGYKSPKYCHVSEIDEEIKKREEELQILKDRKHFYGSNTIICLAEFLHEKLCHQNHTDGCSWHYEKWSDFDNSWTKKRYYAMAKKLLAIEPNMKKIEELILAIREYRI